MDGYYQQFLTSMAGANNQTMAMSEAVGHSPISPTGIPSTFHNFSYLPGYPDLPTGGAKVPKGRRKSSSGIAGADTIKHRRTRSGCFTCRSRRVKCDETRPICERCRKGRRDCSYPEPSSKGGKTKDGSGQKDSQATPTSSGDDIDEEMSAETDFNLATIPDEGEDDGGEDAMTTPSTSSAILPSTSSAETPTDAKPRLQQPLSLDTDLSTLSGTPISEEPSSSMIWSHLPEPFRQYVDYFSHNITHFHFGIVCDKDDFFKTEYLKLAVQDEALLHAVVAFAAYHSNLQSPDGQISVFLKYYNTSIKLLLDKLKHAESYSAATLLTALQLATIEEYLGDGVNLMGHQKAAFHLFVKMFLPENVMMTSLGRMAMLWCTRLDLRICLTGAFEASFPQEWLVAMALFYQEKCLEEPAEVLWKVCERTSAFRLILHDMASYFALRPSAPISPDVLRQYDDLTRRLIEWRQNWDASLTDCRYGVMISSPAAEADFAKSSEPGVLFDYPIFSSSICTAEWHSMMMAHLSHHPENLPGDPEALRKHAYGACQVIGAVSQWDRAPPGALSMLHSILLVALMFLPPDEQHRHWVRRKLAIIEATGYVCAAQRRERVAGAFEDPTCRQWWLPNGEGLTPILKSIIAFTDERNSMSLRAEQDRLREMRTFFV